MGSTTEAELHKQTEREERQRNRSQYTLNAMVMGVAFHDRASLITQHLAIGQLVSLVREVGSPYDQFAIQIRIPQGQIGFIPREQAMSIAALLDQGYRQSAHCSKILQGRRFPIPIIEGRLYKPDATLGTATPSPIPFSEDGPVAAASQPRAPEGMVHGPTSAARVPTGGGYGKTLLALALLVVALAIAFFAKR